MEGRRVEFGTGNASFGVHVALLWFEGVHKICMLQGAGCREQCLQCDSASTLHSEFMHRVSVASGRCKYS